MLIGTAMPARTSTANDGVFRSGGDQSLQKRTTQHACSEGDARATGVSEVFASLARGVCRVRALAVVVAAAVLSFA